MKIVGYMCVKDEADLLPQIYPHIRERVDHLYVYEDGSQDDTWEMVKDADYAIRKVDDKARPDIARPNYHHLLERIKKDFGKEEVWCVSAEGDRFFLNKTPRQIVDEAGGHGAVEAVMLDFLRHRADPWTEENDPWPDMSNIRHLCRWFRFDERFIVAYKLQPHLSYLKAKYTWPRGLQNLPVQYGRAAMDGKVSLDMTYMEHVGRRSPKAAMWRDSSGSRSRSTRKHLSRRYDTFDSVMDTQKTFYAAFKALPWIGLHSLDKFVEIENSLAFETKDFFLGLEHMFIANGCKLPPRTDI